MSTSESPRGFARFQVLEDVVDSYEDIVESVHEEMQSHGLLEDREDEEKVRQFVSDFLGVRDVEKKHVQIETPSTQSMRGN